MWTNHLPDDVVLKIRLEFSSPSFIINAHEDGSKLQLYTDLRKLWVTRVFPQLDAMTALKESLSVPGSFTDCLQ